MATNITLTEWAELVEEFAMKLTRIDPLLYISRSKHSLSAESAGVTVRVGIRAQIEGYYAPEVVLGGSSALPINLAGALAMMESNRATISAVQRVQVWLDRRLRWPEAVHNDGECPCDHCSGRGNHHGVACANCDGKGVR